jgi:ribosomal protein S27E
MSRPRIVDVIVPGSARIEIHTWESALMDVICGRCGHEQAVSRDGHTARCKGCQRVMRLDTAATPERDVVPLRRRAP